MRVLGLELGATLAEAEAKYRVLVRLWHPDRFAADPASAADATERMKRLNEAMTWLRNYASTWSGVAEKQQAQESREGPRVREQRPPDDPPKQERESSRDSEGGSASGSKSNAKPPPPPVAEPTPGPSGMTGPKVFAIAMAAFVLIMFVNMLFGAYRPSPTTTSAPQRGVGGSSISTRPATSTPTNSPSSALQSEQSRGAVAPQASTPTPSGPPPPVTVPPSNPQVSSSNPVEEELSSATDVQLLRSEYETVDAELNRVYQEIRAIAPEDLFIELRDAQRLWIRSRDFYVEDHADFNRGRPAVKGDPESWPEYWQALSARTGARTEYLQGWLRYLEGSQEQENSWDGEWVDSYGGFVYAKQLSPSELGFGIAVWRGPTIHYGQMQGVAQIEGGKATFMAPSDLVEEPSGLVFERDGPTLVVTTFGNVRGFHGARAYFEGTYSRPKPMSDWVSRVVDRLISDKPISFIQWDGEL